jgi:signal peptidase I
MRNKSPFARNIIYTLLLGVVVLIWVYLAPVQVGGRAGYVIVSGISMEPTMYRGDLALLRKTNDYQVGDIVTYYQFDGSPIIHRIVAIDGDQYLLQGDNNSWIDSYHPTIDEVIGELWVHVPGLGNAIIWLRSPIGMAVLGGAAGVLIFMTRSKDNKNEKRGKRRKEDERRGSPPSGLGENATDILFLFGVLGAAALILGIVAIRKPLFLEVADTYPYEHVGSFRYYAEVPDGVYDTNRVQTGEPVFLKLTDAVTVVFEYRLASDLARNMDTIYRLDVEVSDKSGWKRTIVLQPGTTIPSAAFSTTNVVSFDEIWELIHAMEDSTGYEGREYSVAFIPQVTVSGSMQNQLFHETFIPQIEFYIDETALWLVDSNVDEFGRITASQTGSIDIPHLEPNTMTILGFEFKVETARQVAFAGLVIAIAGMVVVGVLATRALQAGDEARIRFRAGSRLVSIRHNGLDRGMPLVEVTTVDDLIRLAFESDGPILYESLPDNVRRYFVQGENVNYFYELRQPKDVTPKRGEIIR